MPGQIASAVLSHLESSVRTRLEDWARSFEFDWQPRSLDEFLASLPQDLVPWRKAALAELVRIDLSQRWQREEPVTLETYLEQYPELGTVETVTPELILAEIEARHEAGQRVKVAQFASRFPHQMPRVQELLRESQFSGISKQAEDSKRDQPANLNSSMKVSHGSQLPSTFTNSNGTPKDNPSLSGLFGDKDRYQIVKQLGQGGMGAVYLATDTKMHRKVALKVTHFAPNDTEMRERFIREAQLLAGIKHANLGVVYDVDEFAGTLFQTMEFIDGKTLADYLKSRRMTPKQAITLVRKSAQALAEAHRHGIVHRDIKPANIMLRREGGEPTVIDFGLAVDLSPNAARNTRSGTQMGTLHYMPIEQIDGNLSAIGPRSDVYSLGVVLYELLTGRLPFPASFFTEVLAQMAQGAPPITTHQPDLDPRLNDIVMKAIARKPEDRYESMAEFDKALQAYLRAPKFVPPPTASAAAAALNQTRSTGSDGTQSLNPAEDPSVNPADDDESVGASFFQQLEQQHDEELNLPRTQTVPGARSVVTPSATTSSGTGAKPSLLRTVTQPITNLLEAPTAAKSRQHRAFLVALSLIMAVLLYGMTIWFRSGDALVKVEVLSDDIEVTFQNETLTVTDESRPFKITPGEHTLHIKSGNTEFDTDKFTLKKGQNPAVTVEFETSEIVTKLGNDQIGRQLVEKSATDSDVSTKTAMIKRADQRLPANELAKNPPLPPNAKAIHCIASLAIRGRHVYGLDGGWGSDEGDLWIFQIPDDVAATISPRVVARFQRSMASNDRNPLMNPETQKEPIRDVFEIGVVRAAGTGAGLAIVGDVLFCPKEGAINAYSLQNPDQPKRIGTFGNPKPAQTTYDLQIIGNNAVLFHQSGLTIYDVTEPHAPRLIGAIDLSGSSMELTTGAFRGNRLYAAARSFLQNEEFEGIIIFDVSDIRSPKEVGRIQTWKTPYKLFWTRDQKLLALLGERVQLYDVSNPNLPIVHGGPLRVPCRTGLIMNAQFENVVVDQDWFSIVDGTLEGPSHVFPSGGITSGHPHHGASANDWGVLPSNRGVLLFQAPKSDDAKSSSTIEMRPSSTRSPVVIAPGQWIPLVTDATKLPDPEIWSFKDGVLRGGNGKKLDHFAHADLPIEGIKAKDVIVRSRVTIREAVSSDVMVKLRVSEKGGYHVFYNNWYGAGKMVGKQWKSLREVSNGPKYFPREIDYAVAAVGNRLTLFLEGKNVLDLTDNDHSEGSISLAVKYVGGTFKNPEVMILDGVAGVTPEWVEQTIQKRMSDMSGATASSSDSSSVPTKEKEPGSNASPRVVTPATWEPAKHELHLSSGGYISDVAIVPGEKEAFSINLGGVIKLWNLETGTLVRDVSVQDPADGWVFNGKAFHSGTMMAMVGINGRSLKIWDLQQSKLLRTLPTRTSEWPRVASTPTGDRVIFTSDAGVQVLQIDKQGNFKVLADLPGSTEVAVSPSNPDHVFYALKSDPKIVCMYDVAQKQQRFRVIGHTAKIDVFKLSADGTRLVTLANDETICVTNATSGALLHRINCPRPTGSNHLALSSNGRRAILLGIKNAPEEWSLDEERKVRDLPFPDRHHCHYFANDQKIIAVISGIGDMGIWDLPSPVVRPNEAGIPMDDASLITNEPPASSSTSATKRTTGVVSKLKPNNQKVVINSVGMRLCRIPAGKFLMGSPVTEKGRGADEVQHQVTISKPFLIGAFEVTQDEYKRVMGTNPSRFARLQSAPTNVDNPESCFPVECVSISDAKAFCEKLSESPGEKQVGRTYRLPTEAEWEYACRSGTTGPWSDAANLAVRVNVARPFLPDPGTVGAGKPNAWGLYGTHGNVWEWCVDLYGPYASTPQTDPLQKSGDIRVIRGGWHADGQNSVGSAERHSMPDARLDDIGFRVVCEER